MTKACVICGTVNAAEASFCMTCSAQFREQVKAYDAFISYRRESGSHIATALQAVLESQYRKRVFLDVRELQIGRFDEKLLTLIEQTPSFILILSCGCLDRCAEKGDWLKREVMHALEHRRRIIPVMMEDFRFPSDEQSELLPEAMRVLPSLQAIVYSHIHQDSAIRRIAEALTAAPDVGGVEAEADGEVEPADRGTSGAGAGDGPRAVPSEPPPGAAVLTYAPADSVGVRNFSLQLLRDPGLPRSALVIGTDDVIREQPLEMVKIRLRGASSWSPRGSDLMDRVELADDVNIPLAEINTVEVVKAPAGGAKRLRVIRVNGSVEEGELRDNDARIAFNREYIPFDRVRRMEFGSLRPECRRFELCAEWGKAEVDAVAFTPDGKLLAAASSGGPLLFEVPDLTPVPFVAPTTAPWRVHSISISADGALVASTEFPLVGSRNVTTFTIRHLRDGSVVRKWPNDVSANGWFSPKEPGLLAAVEGNSRAVVGLYAAREGTLLRSLKGHTNDVTAVAFSSDGQQVATASRDKTVKIWGVDRGTCERTLLDSPEELAAVSWSPDSRLLFGLTWSGLMVWSCGDWRRKLELSLPSSSASGVRRMVRCADPARPWLALSDPEHVLLWNWETGQIEAIRDEERSILAMEFNPAGLLATASKDSCLRLWRVA